MESLSSNMNRNIGLDACKFIAMMGVVALHTINLEECEFLGFILRESAVISVPLFFMVSGYLLLGRKKSDYHYSFNKIKGILRCEFILCIIYWVAYSIYHNNFCINDLVYNVLGGFFQHGPFWMFWYLGVMIIIYLLYPVINYLFLVRQNIFRNLTITLFIVCLVAFIGNICSGNLGRYSELNIPQTFRLHTWLLYFCIGGEVQKFMTKKIGMYLLVLVLGANVLMQYLFFPYLSGVMVFYSSPIGIAATVICFIWICQHKHFFNENIYIRLSSKIFLPVYILHPFVIAVTQSLLALAIFYLGNYSYLIYWLFVSFLAITLSVVIMKVKYVNYIFRI